MIRFKHKGDFSRLDKYLENVKNAVKLGKLDQYGRQGVEALESATPKDTGFTSKSWSYMVNNTKNSMVLEFHNTHINLGVPIAIILHYGHGTRQGGYVPGFYYITPAISPIFDRLTEDTWKEVTSL